MASVLDPTTGLLARASVGLGLACAAFAFPAAAQTVPVPSANPIASTTTVLTDSSLITSPQPSAPALTPAISSIDDDLVEPAGPQSNRIDTREGTIDGLRPRLDPTRNDAPGIRLGSFVLKPTLSEKIVHENTDDTDGKRSRSFLETGGNGVLTSDWSRHQLVVTGDGAWQNNISGRGQTRPRADIDARLRLDIDHATIANFNAGYSFRREDATDPNALSNADTQAGVSRTVLGAGIARDLGLLRGGVKLDLERYSYGNARLINGQSLSLRDRNRDQATLTGRLGFELSPALVPFIEAAVGTSRYELRRDFQGYERSARTTAARTGVELDMGEKLRGELALGYEKAKFRDVRLRALDAFTVDGRVVWSPHRGTDVTLGLATAIEPSTTAGESGSVNYTLSADIRHELRSTMVAQLTNSLTLRDYSNSAFSNDEKIWFSSAGLTWNFSRYLALTGDVSYERTTQANAADTSITRVGVGLALRR
ncbi:outer membrane beta-barrel protein [Rhizobium sp. CFBP 8762]|uniref:outer membrane beta-barrel protein n=1 Tax=Rhizobium sp. CFBP 8762 TaxID=2775279 RepID=UPI001FD3EDE8|nr:outer membrane beta-barrel protein [Rhizobium sp. CFBP 8762]